MAPTPRASICDLPNEILLSIFSLLPVADLARCAATCERWRRIVRHFTCLWKGKEYSSNNSPADCAETRAVLHALPSFEAVRIDSIDGFRVEVSYPLLFLSVKYVRVLEDFPRLKCRLFYAELDIAGDIVSRQSIVDFERLLRLEIEPINGLNSWAPRNYSVERVIRAALTLCPRLIHLRVSADSVTADDLDAVQDLGRLRSLNLQCPGLEKLSFLRHCSDALEELWLGSRQFEPADMAAAVAGLGSLKDLAFEGCCSANDLCQLQKVCTTLPERGAMVGLPDLWMDRSGSMVAIYLEAVDLSTALSRLEELGLPASCLGYLNPLRCCPQLRRIQCDFMQGSDEPEQSDVQVYIIIIEVGG